MMFQAITVLLFAALSLPFAAARLASHRRTDIDALSDSNGRSVLQADPLNSADPRIVGGTSASQDDFPFFVSWSGCGGSLIHEDIVMTAAHCSPFITSNFVYVGAYRAFSSALGAEEKTVILRRPHPGFSDPTMENDIMLMKISTPSGKTPVQLAGPGDPNSGDSFIAIGHGVTDTSTMQISDILRQVTVPYVNDTECQALYAGFVPQVVPNVMICAGAAGFDSCQGDSGGPLLKQLSSGDYVQYGITSWGNGCGKTDAPGVYARVSAFTSWIDQQICAMSSSPPMLCQIPPGIPVRVEITFDRYPGENSWSISYQNGNVVASRSRLDCSYQRGFTSERIYLPPGEYTFTMNDSYADGMNCGGGNGKIDIYAEIDSGDALLFKSNGRFGNTISGPLSVSQNSTSVSSGSDPGCPGGLATLATVSSSVGSEEGDLEGPDSVIVLP